MVNYTDSETERRIESKVNRFRGEIRKGGRNSANKETATKESCE